MSAYYITQSGYHFDQIRKLTIANDGAELQVAPKGKVAGEGDFRPLTPEDQFDPACDYCFGGGDGTWVHPRFDSAGWVIGMARYGANNEDKVMHHLADTMCYEG